MKSVLLVALFFAVAAIVHAETPSRRPMTVDDLWTLQRVGSPAVSPDGRQVVFTVARYSMETNESETDLWLVPSDGSAEPRQLTWAKGSDSSPAWSPDGRRLAFIAKRAEGPPQLHVLPLDGGEAEPVTDLPVGVSTPRWFPDGRKIAFLASTFPDLGDDLAALKKRLEERKADKVQARVSENRLLRYWDEYRTDGTVPHVFEVDLETRKVRDLMPGNSRVMGLREVNWDLSPDGGEIAFAANATDPPYHKLNFSIFLLDLATGKIRALSSDSSAEDGSPRYSPDGRWLVFSRVDRPDIPSDQAHLVRYDRRSGEFLDLTLGWDHEPSGFRFTPDGQTLVFSAEDQGRNSLWAQPVASATPRLLVRGGDAGSAEPTADGHVVFVLGSTAQPADLWRVPLAGSELRQLTRFNQELLHQLDLGKVEEMHFEGAGGDVVQAWVVKPPGFDPAKKWPLLVLVHGGPHNAWLDSFHYRWNAPLFAAPGYVVAGLNFHGSTGFGQAFADSIVGNHGDKPFEDVMKLTDAMVGSGFIDEKRMAAAGGSYGGYLVSWILGHTDRFAALVDHAGVYDLMAQFASDYTWERSTSYGAEPWEDPNRIDLYSPSRYAKNFNTPTLILHGELDYRVPVTQGINLYGVLQGKGVPARIVIFPNENHWIAKPQASQLWWNEVFAWLERWIGKGAG